jgi:hypothetical protein
MRVWSILIAIACLASCAAPSAPPPIPPPSSDINSDEFKEWFAARQREELQEAAKSKTNVTRKFYVGWEMHFGFYLEPEDSQIPGSPRTLNRIFPDFADDHVESQFWAVSEVPKIVVCECTGVEFSDGRRFLVREAKFELREQ